jgi:hypothetical protein
MSEHGKSNMSRFGREMFELALAANQPKPKTDPTETCGQCCGQGWYGEWGRPTICQPCGGTGRVAAIPTHSGSDFSVQAELSLQLEVVARALFKAAWILVGKPDTPFFHEMPLHVQQRYRYLAERAIATIDPKIRLEAQAEAAKDTEAWMDGPYDPANIPTHTDIANFAIGSYESILAGCRIGKERVW